MQQNESTQQTVLVVDDTPDNLAVLGELLTPYYSVRIANSGARALIAAVSEPRPDLILLDIMMPAMDGYQVLQHLKASQDTADIPVIFVTALDATEDEARGLALGAVDYISKPLKPPIVLARVRTQLELKQARDILRNNNEWLERELMHRMRENQMVQDVSMRALASLAETRDNETGSHILRTQAYVELLCRELASRGFYPEQLSERKIELITKAAPLHDIGKVGIPDHILLKPDQLSEDEWKIMRTHTTLGAEAIRRAISNEIDLPAFDFLHVAMEIACYHHEKWDGSGYPLGLKGQDIPLSARVMALADVFDALLNRRCYKVSMSVERAIDIILADKGKHFDPDIVDAFIARQSEFIAISNRHADHPDGLQPHPPCVQVGAE